MSFEKVEDQDMVTEAPKSMYTYAVNMIVSVFAENEVGARSTLDQSGGFVSHRNVELKDVISIYRPEDKD
jgi:hypothetical protein